MNPSCNAKTPLLSGCNPTITVLCILSCTICTIVMIWGVYAMRTDMARMEQMMGPADTTASHVMSVDPSTIMSSEMMTPASSDDTAMRDHCRTMPAMVGCERFR